MVRFIAAIDEKRGIATDTGIPWKLPTDSKFFEDQIVDGLILMGSGTYREFQQPLHDRTNYVLTHSTDQLRPGFETVHDLEAFFRDHSSEQINDIGGAGLFAQSIKYADELILTQIKHDFHCTKFFPEYEHAFTCVNGSESITENGITFRFETWHRKLAVPTTASSELLKS
jgi:dihydrofolate reductase